MRAGFWGCGHEPWALPIARSKGPSGFPAGPARVVCHPRSGPPLARGHRSLPDPRLRANAPTDSGGPRGPEVSRVHRALSRLQEPRRGLRRRGRLPLVPARLQSPADPPARDRRGRGPERREPSPGGSCAPGLPRDRPLHRWGHPELRLRRRCCRRRHEHPPSARPHLRWRRQGQMALGHQALSSRRRPVASRPSRPFQRRPHGSRRNGLSCARAKVRPLSAPMRLRCCSALQRCREGARAERRGEKAGITPSRRASASCSRLEIHST